MKEKSNWWQKKFSEMKGTIGYWERYYNKVGVYIMVEAQERVTRSPGKRAAIAEWKEQNDIEKLLTFPEFSNKVQLLKKKTLTK